MWSVLVTGLLINWQKKLVIGLFRFSVVLMSMKRKDKENRKAHRKWRIISQITTYL